MDAKLATKIYNVMCAVEGIEKGTIVGKGTKSEYRAVGEKDVLNVIKPLLKENKLICIPRDGEIAEYVNLVEAYSKVSTRAITQLKIYFLLVDIETGEETQIVGFGNGADSQDKGSGKAFTYAYKTALQKTFCMFSGEDTDSTHSNNMNGTDTKSKPSSKEFDKLAGIAKDKGITYDQLELYSQKKYHVAFTKIDTPQYVEMLKYVSSKKV